MINPIVIAQYEERGFKVTCDADRKVAMCLKETPKNRINRFKVAFNYRFPTIEKMIEYVENWIAAEIGHEVVKAERRAQRAADRKARVAEMADNVKVGDIFVNSWGYDQTNVNAYEVVAKPSAATVVIREIGMAAVEGSYGRDCQRVMPVAGAFIGEEEKRRIGQYGIKTQYGNASPAAAGATFYNSWYA